MHDRGGARFLAADLREPGTPSGIESYTHVGAQCMLVTLSPLTRGNFTKTSSGGSLPGTSASGNEDGAQRKRRRKASLSRQGRSLRYRANRGGSVPQAPLPVVGGSRKGTPSLRAGHPVGVTKNPQPIGPARKRQKSSGTSSGGSPSEPSGSGNGGARRKKRWKARLTMEEAEIIEAPLQQPLPFASVSRWGSVPQGPLPVVGGSLSFEAKHPGSITKNTPPKGPVRKGQRSSGSNSREPLSGPLLPVMEVSKGKGGGRRGWRWRRLQLLRPLFSNLSLLPSPTEEALYHRAPIILGGGHTGGVTKKLEDLPVGGRDTQDQAAEEPYRGPLLPAMEAPQGKESGRRGLRWRRLQLLQLLNKLCLLPPPAKGALYHRDPHQGTPIGALCFR